MSEEQQPYDAGDEEQVAKRARRARNVEQDRKTAINEWLSTKQGRELFGHIIHELCGLYDPINAAGSASFVHFQEGARSVGIYLHEMALDAAPDQYMVLLRENILKR